MPALFLLLCVVVRHCFRAIEPKMTQKFVSFLLVLLGLCYTQWNCFATNPQTAPILYTKHTGISLKASARGVLQPLVLVSIIGNVPKSIISVLRSRVRCELDAQQGCRKNQFCLSGVVSRAGIALSLSLWGLVQIQARFMLLATTPSVAACSVLPGLTRSLCVFSISYLFLLRARSYRK